MSGIVHARANAPAPGRRPHAALLLALLVAASACGGGGGGSETAASDCAACHALQTAAFDYPSSHQILFECTSCHEERRSSPGPGHRSVTTCDQCHSEAGHPPARDSGDATPAADQGSTGASSCAVCHDPHGSSNLFLIRGLLELPEGTTVPMFFLDLSGRADWSYAELPASEGGENDREPGQGLCEACHTRTRVYNRYGTGAPHFTGRCVDCHDHADGFSVSR
jgi:hypothetical protein